jgi:hypothetical protein
MTAPQNLPEFRSHKVVRAAKIKAAEFFEDGSGLVMIDGHEGPVAVPAGFVRPGHSVAEGDWFIVYPDGYVSWCPEMQFAYRLVADEPTKEPEPATAPEPVRNAADLAFPILMSKLHPTGWKLEELLDKAADEVETLKTPLIRDDPRPVAQSVVTNNGHIVAMLRSAARIQRDSYRMLATVGPNAGPLGKPRIGKGS